MAEIEKSESPAATGAGKLLAGPVSVINVGLEGFAAELRGVGVPVVQVQWQPPAGGDAKLAALLAKLGT
jgi:FdrA protein